MTCSRRLRVLEGVRRHDRDRIAELEHLFVAKDRAVPAVALVGGECDQAGDPVLAGYILMRYDLVHAGHLLGFGSVDALDVGVGNVRLHEREAQGPFRHLQGDASAP